MGFFQRIFGGGENKVRKQDVSPHSLTPWNDVRINRTVVIDGDSPRTVYVYDSGPLSNVNAGQIIEMDAFRGDAAMRSVHTGTFSSTDDRSDTCLMYDGQAVGFVSLPLGEVRKAADTGLALKIRCRVEGMLAGYSGVKEVVAFLPQRVYASDIIDQDNALKAGVPANAESVEYHEYDEADYQDLLPRDEWEFMGARLQYLPVPEGSRAKPHVAVVSDEGMMISRVTARNSYYKDLVTAMDAATNFYVSARRWTRHDGQPAYRIVVRYW